MTYRRTPVLLFALLVICSVGAAQAQYPYGRPTDITLLQNAAPGGGALTPDGRILVTGEAPPYNGWFARVLRHENITKNANGTPQFAANAWSTPVQFGFDGFPPTWTGYPPCPDLYFSHSWLTIAPDPAFSAYPVPFRSDKDGNYTPYAPLEGSSIYATYRLVVIAPTTWFLEPGSQFSFANPTWSASPGSPLVVLNPVARRHLKLVVASPGTASATIYSAVLQEPQAELLSWSEQVNGVQIVHPILGIEPSITHDGRLLILHSNPINNGIREGATIQPMTGERIMYSFNPTPFATSGWSQPRNIDQMHAQDASTMVDGLRFDRRYPIAQQPLRDGAGVLIAQDYGGAYPWITMDGSDIVHMTNYVYGTTSVRTGMSIIGQSTGWKLQHIDGPLNPDRVTTQRFVATGTGLSPGIWSPGRDLPNAPLPYTQRTPSLPLFLMIPARYGEVDLEAYSDQDYFGAYSMNECIQSAAAAPKWAYDITRTSDTSGLGNTGVLSGGAVFGKELPGGLDTNDGAIGRAIWFPDNGRVSIPASSAASQALVGVSIELFVRVVTVRGTAPRTRGT